MPLAQLVDPFKQVKLFVNEEVEANGDRERGSTGEMQVEVEEMKMPCSSSNVTLIEEGKLVNSWLELYHHQILFHFAGKKGPFLQ